MKTWEAMKALEEGKKVREISWDEGYYIYYKEGVVYNSDGESTHFIAVNPKFIYEVYDDREEISTPLKDLYKLYSSENICDEYMTCSNCPLADYQLLCTDIERTWKGLQEMNKKYKLDK